MSTLEGLKLGSLGLVSADLHPQPPRVRFNPRELLESPHYEEWGYDFLLKIHQDDYSEERRYFFGKMAPLPISGLKPAEEVQKQDEIEKLYSFKPGIDESLRNLVGSACNKVTF